MSTETIEQVSEQTTDALTLVAVNVSKVVKELRRREVARAELSAEVEKLRKSQVDMARLREERDRLVGRVEASDMVINALKQENRELLCSIRARQVSAKIQKKK
jgi:hypothetical protein